MQSLFSKDTLSKFVLKPSGMLPIFELKLYEATHDKKCPYPNCGKDLKRMATKPFHYCRNKNHPRFIISNSKIK